MTTLNGIPRSWDSFIQGICARIKLISFSKLWEECIQEESRLIKREENMGEIKDQSLTIHIKRNHRNEEITITTKGRTIITKDQRNTEEILPISDATLVMRMGTTP